MELPSLMLAFGLVHAILIVAAPLNSTCHDYVLISTRGTSQPQGPSVAFTGMIEQVLTAIPNGIEYDTIYPAAESTESIGGADIVKYINNGLTNCPSQNYALLGYSQGAAASAIALADYPDPESAAFKAIKAVVLLGNPIHAPNKPGNVDENGSSANAMKEGVFYKHGLRIPDKWYATKNVIDICYSNDLVCEGVSLSSIISSLKPPVPHVAYGTDSKVQSLGAEHVISRLR